MTITPAANSNITITGVELTASSGYTKTTKYNVDNGSDQTLTWNGTTGTVSNISATTSFKFRNANQANNTEQLRITQIKITYTQPASGPTQLAAPATFQATSVGDQQASFSWSAVEYASSYTITCTPTVGNAVIASNLTGTSTTVSGLTNDVAYTCKINAIGNGTEYSDSDDKYLDGTITPTAAQQFTVTIAGGITGGSVEADPTTATAGTTINVTANPNGGYYLSALSYTNGQTTTDIDQTTLQFQMPASDITINATFTAYTVTLNACGGTIGGEQTATWHVGETNGNLPAAIPPCNTWTFYGWKTTSAVGDPTTTAQTCVNGTGYTPEGNITLYAVYSKTEGGGNTDGTVTLASGVYNSSTPATITWTEDYITILQEKGTSSTAVSNSYISNPRWYQNHVITMTPTSTVNSITITQYDGKYGLEDSGTSITNGSASVDNHVVTITPTNGNQAVVITMGAQARISAISVNYVGSTTYYHSTPDCTETVATPTFDPVGGTLYGTTTVHINCTTEGASIFYTLNGDEPTNTASATNFAYSAQQGISVSAATTIKAKAFKTDWNPSATATATYTVQHDVEEPLMEDATFTADGYEVTIIVPNNTTVYYTTDGTTPDNNSDEYDENNPFTINATTTVKAIAYDGDGCASDVVTATYTRAYTLAGAKALYEGSDVTNVTISLNGVQFIAKSGSSTYMQQGTTGLMIYGSHSQDLTNGDRFTAGTVTGTITKYGENLELSISSGAFANVAKTAGTLTASATDVEITDVTGDFSTYESRYVALESLEMSVTDKTLSDGTNTLAIYDPFHVLDEAIQPDDDVIVTGVVTSYYKNSNTTYQIIPLNKSGITTGIAATLPTLDPVGGADAAHAVSTETVIVTPATSTTVTYTFGSSAYGEINAETEITVPSTEATELEVVASRDFYTDNSTSYYYKSAAASYTVNFYENGELTYSEDNVVSGTSLAISSTTAPNGYEFMGWTTAAISDVQAGAPATLYNGSVTVENDMNLYAVYALEGETNVTYTLVGAGSVTAGTYIIGALRSASTPENDYFYFADGSISNGDMNTDDNYVEIEAVAGVRQITQKPSAAQEFVFTGDNTNGFTICKVGTTDYLGYSSKANRKIAFGNTYSTYAWTVFEKTDLMANGVRLRKSTDYYIGENSTGTGSIRGYVDNTGRAIYLFKKAETPAYSNYCTTVSVPPSLPIVEGVLTDDYTIPTGAAYTLTSSITVPSGKTLIVPANAVFANANPANLIIADGGQLVISNDVAATVKKDIAKYNNATDKDGWYTIASPVAGANVSLAQLDTYDLFAYDEENHKWLNVKDQENSITTFAQGQGFLYANSANQTLPFAGTMKASDATVTVPLSWSSIDGKLKGFNLVGNPFTCNVTSGMVTMNGEALTTYYVAEGGSNLVTRNLANTPIKPGRGFFVQAPSECDLVFNPGAKGEMDYKPTFISIEAGNGEFADRAYVQLGYGNTLRKMSINDNTPMVYVMNNDADYAAATVNALKGTMPVCFRAKETGHYTISVATEGLDMSYLHLIDRLTGADIDLLIEPSYSFIATKDDNQSRFILSFTADCFNEDEDEIFAYQNGNEIFVNGEGELQVFDVMGRMVATQRINGVETVNIPAQGVYIMRLNEKTQKIVVR